MGFMLAKKVWDEEGMGGLKDRPKSGRYPKKVSRQMECRIKIILKESNQGWCTAKQVEEKIIIEKRQG